MADISSRSAHLVLSPSVVRSLGGHQWVTGVVMVGDYGVGSVG